MSGSVSDGNGGNNYAVTFVSNTTGVINQAPLTFTAAANAKTYDGTTSAATTPAVSGLQGSDTVTGLSETYDTKNVGSGKTLTVAAGYTVSDGNGGANYAVTTASSTAGVINQAGLTITALANTKTYDGRCSAAATPMVVGLVGSDTVTGLSETYDTKNAGTGKTLSVAAGYAVSDGNGGGNYTVTTATSTAGVIDQAPLTVTAAGVNKIYDGATTATVVPLRQPRCRRQPDRPLHVGELQQSGAGPEHFGFRQRHRRQRARRGQLRLAEQQGQHHRQRLSSGCGDRRQRRRDGGWTTTGAWSNYPNQGYDGDIHQAVLATTAASTATWTFGDLDPNEYYKVETTWTTNGPAATSNRASNAPYTTSGGTVALPVYVNQKLAPAGVSGNNGTWQELGVYEPTSGTLAVTLSNSANGYVIADAVRIEPVPAAGPAIMVQASGAANNGVAGVVLPTLSGTVQTAVSFGTVAARTVSQETFTVFNGGGPLSISSVSVPAGYTFVAGSGFTNSGTATVLPGDSAEFVLQENTSAVGTFSGTVTLATNDLVTLAGGAVSGSFSFPVAGTVIAGLILDDSAGAAGGFATTGMWSKWASQPSYYEGDDLQAASAGATATWTFGNLTPRSTYQVYVTWPAQSNRASGVPYTVTVGGGVTSLSVNQKLAPSTPIAGSGPSEGSWSWYQLPSGTAVDGSFTVGATGTVVVEVSNSGLPASTAVANNVEADAVMLVPTTPELAAGGPGHNPNAALLTASEAMPLVHEAEVRWAAAGANVKALGSVQVMVGKLPGAELGESSSLVDTIYLDSNAQGYGWFVDPTPGQDSEFPLRVSATEERANSSPAAGEWIC